MGLSALYFACVCVLLFAEGQRAALGAGEGVTGEGVLPRLLNAGGSPAARAAAEEGASTGPALARRQLAFRRGAASGALPVKGSSTLKGAAPVKGAAPGKRLTTVKGGVFPADANALLMALTEWQKNLTDNRGLLGNWTRNHPCSDWHGVTCDKSQRVTALALPALGNPSQPFFALRSFPPELGSLAKLGYLNLARNPISSPTVPKQWTGLRKLSHLDLSQASYLSWPHASDPLQVVWSLTGLTYLNLAYFPYSSSGTSLPRDFTRLSKLAWLDLSWYFVGTVQPLLRLTGLKSLSIRYGGQQLPATVANIGRLTGLQELDLSYNKFGGTIPSWLENLRQLTSLDLYYTAMVGTIPSSLGALSKLARLSLGNNSLTGAPPKTILNSPRLTYLDLSFNLNLNLAGLALGAKLQYLNLAGNGIKGTIPKGISGLTGLTFLSLSENSLSGNLPQFLSAFSHLSALNLSNNILTGPIPSGAGALTSLTSLDLSRNQLTESIPVTLSRLSGLSKLHLSYNGLTGSIPGWPFTLGKLVELKLDSNRLSGSLPGVALDIFALNFALSRGGLPSLLDVDVSKNFLTGPCYSTIGADQIQCDNGGTEGSCPPLRMALKRLDQNCLTGCKNNPFGVLTPNQRGTAACAKFCGADKANGPCNGHGTCSLKGLKQTPTCTCDKGFVALPTPGACKKK